MAAGHSTLNDVLFATECLLPIGILQILSCLTKNLRWTATGPLFALEQLTPYM